MAELWSGGPGGVGGGVGAMPTKAWINSWYLLLFVFIEVRGSTGAISAVMKPNRVPEEFITGSPPPPPTPQHPGQEGSPGPRGTLWSGGWSGWNLQGGWGCGGKRVCGGGGGGEKEG